MDLDLIIAFNDISETIIKLNLSEQDLVNKTPHKKDLIDSVRKSKEKLTKAYLKLKELEVKFMASSKRNFDLERILLEKEAELRVLKGANQEYVKELINKF